MKDKEWLRSELEKIYIPYPEEAFVEWWIENDLLPPENVPLNEATKRRKENKGRLYKKSQVSWSKTNPFKVCSVCKESKHITNYHTRQDRCQKHGYLHIMSKCKQCAWIATTPMVKRKVYQGDAEKRGKKAKKLLMKYFDGCDRCGYKGQPPQMDLDHLNPKEKSFALSSGVLAHKSIDEIMEEVSKCQMLCSNCHRLVSSKYEHHIKDDITYHPINDKVLYTMSSPEQDREFLRRDSQ